MDENLTKPVNKGDDNDFRTLNIKLLISYRVEDRLFSYKGSVLRMRPVLLTSVLKSDSYISIKCVSDSPCSFILIRSHSAQSAV